MKRLYQYKGFQIDVETEPVWKPNDGASLTGPDGYLAVVRISTQTAGVPLFAPLRLTAERSNPFPTEAEALMAGYSAGQRVIDNTATA
ncbi:hypothetical protein CUJ91_04635 [Paraburkholderia graminis]|uniref:hypothetical protein n=1 Tax=Paraburkholderia graminis TaxID=60548 RepID=UPI000DEFBB00|nr:hypothetical protein [Paraburkholderia graminis]AXF07284.1 hypothetical protein CUJ91_04635 [Paraburkholderia graminis]